MYLDRCRKVFATSSASNIQINGKAFFSPRLVHVLVDIIGHCFSPRLVDIFGHAEVSPPLAHLSPPAFCQERR